jgi:nucleoside-diphosphate-sugar epimerase
MLEAARHAKKTASGDLIKFIFTSSLAVYGGKLPDVVDSTTITTPEGAYGTGKLVAELLVNEYSRRGLVDGRILRLPTIVVRPGVPSAATSAFISGIIREPLHGEPALCPVGDGFDSPELELAAWVASPEITISNFVQAKHVPAEKFLPHTRAVYLPGFTTTVREEIAALKEVAGEEALKLITFKVCPSTPEFRAELINRMTQQTDVSSLRGLLSLITLTHSVLDSRQMREVWSLSFRGSRMRLLEERHKFCSYSIGFYMHSVHHHCVHVRRLLILIYNPVALTRDVNLTDLNVNAKSMQRQYRFVG